MTTNTPNNCKICNHYQTTDTQFTGNRCLNPGHWQATGQLEPHDYYQMAELSALAQEERNRHFAQDTKESALEPSPLPNSYGETAAIQVKQNALQKITTVKQPIPIPFYYFIIALQLAFEEMPFWKLWLKASSLQNSNCLAQEQIPGRLDTQLLDQSLAKMNRYPAALTKQYNK